MMAKVKLADVVRWLATVIQLIGYGMTGFIADGYDQSHS
jgi:hypothetical protein